jgi:hypothetical protein
MLEIFKKDLLHGYEKFTNSQSKIVFREINKENGYEEDIEKDGGDIVIDYTQFHDGFTCFSVIPELMEFVKKFSMTFSDDFFSIKAFEYLFDYLEKYIKKYPRWLYRQEEALVKYMVYYGLSNKQKIAYSKIQNTTKQIAIGSPYQNITDEYKELYPDNAYFGTLIGNEIVSITGTNGMENEVVDIGFDTNINHRNKGYAVSNTIGLSEYLLNNNRMVKISCNNLNTFSNKSAISSGFQLIAKEKTIWCPYN